MCARALRWEGLQVLEEKSREADVSVGGDGSEQSRNVNTGLCDRVKVLLFIPKKNRISLSDDSKSSGQSRLAIAREESGRHRLFWFCRG